MFNLDSLGIMLEIFGLFEPAPVALRSIEARGIVFPVMSWIRVVPLQLRTRLQRTVKVVGPGLGKWMRVILPSLL